MIKKINPFLTLVFILSIAAIFLLLTDYIEKNNLDIFSRASGDNVPQELFLSDITDSSIVLNWYTTRDTTAFVKVTRNGVEEDTVFDDLQSKYHRLEIKNLQEASSYKVSIFSDGEEFSNLENSTFMTARSVITSTSFPVYGQIFDNTGVGLLKEGIVSIQLDNGEKSQIYSTEINVVGGYQFNLQDLRSEDLMRTYDRNKPGVASIVVYNVGGGNVKKSIPYDFSKSRQFVNIVAGEENIEEIPGVNGQ